MKLLKFGLLVSMTLVLSSFLGCKSNLDNEYPSNEGKSQIAKNIQLMKKNGLFDSILNESRSASESDEEQEMMLRFINDTDSVLEEIASSENGAQEMKVIEAVFNGASTEEFAEAFSAINPEKSAEYLDYVNENLVFEENPEVPVSRSAMSESNAVRLQYNIPRKIASRGAYADNFDWNTIGWYTGFCAATVAGFYMVSYGGFWVKIAGGVAALAGAASMAAQIGIWANCSELGSLISSLFSQESEGANAAIRNENGNKLVMIAAETAATVIACYISPFGYSLVNYVVSEYNAFIERFLSHIPKGLNLFINGYKIAPITL